MQKATAFFVKHGVSMTNTNGVLADYFIDITQDRCPMTFVKTRLRLDKMESGESLAVRLSSGEPLENVPRSAKELGYEVSEPTPDDGNAFVLIITKP